MNVQKNAVNINLVFFLNNKHKKHDFSRKIIDKQNQVNLQKHRININREFFKHKHKNEIIISIV